MTTANIVSGCGGIEIPFLDLFAGCTEIQSDLSAAINRVIASSHFILGPELEAFEAEFAEFCGARFCVGVGNGLDALTLTLRALDIGVGDEVLVPAHTYVATWLAVANVGAIPVGVDVGNDFTIDTRAIERLITPRTRAIIPVHLYGQPARMDEILDLSTRYSLAVIEDAAQAHGAGYRGRRAGTLGLAGCFSFYPTKNLGAFGDGGAITTDDQTLASRLRRLRNYGSETKYVHVEQGFNSRLDELQAAVLRVKLRHLATKNSARRALAEGYSKALTGLPIVLPYARPENEHSWHLFVIQSEQRDTLAAHLRLLGISTLVHYPIPPHLQAAMARYAYKHGSFPRAERMADEVLSLPFWPEMDPNLVGAIADAIYRHSPDH